MLPVDDLGRKQLLKRRVRKGPNLKDDLAEMVREDPEAAASILHNWINSAG